MRKEAKNTMMNEAWHAHVPVFLLVSSWVVWSNVKESKNERRIMIMLHDDNKQHTAILPVLLLAWKRAC